MRQTGRFAGTVIAHVRQIGEERASEISFESPTVIGDDQAIPRMILFEDDLQRQLLDDMEYSSASHPTFKAIKRYVDVSGAYFVFFYGSYCIVDDAEGEGKSHQLLVELEHALYTELAD